jgi:hypothetical protein
MKMFSWDVYACTLLNVWATFLRLFPIFFFARNFNYGSTFQVVYKLLRAQDLVSQLRSSGRTNQKVFDIYLLIRKWFFLRNGWEFLKFFFFLKFCFSNGLNNFEFTVFVIYLFVTKWFCFKNGQNSSHCES